MFSSKCGQSHADSWGTRLSTGLIYMAVSGTWCLITLSINVRVHRQAFNFHECWKWILVCVYRMTLLCANVLHASLSLCILTIASNIAVAFICIISRQQWSKHVWKIKVTCTKGYFPHPHYAVSRCAGDARVEVNCVIAAVMLSVVSNNHRCSACCVPHFTFRILPIGFHEPVSHTRASTGRHSRDIFQKP